MELKPVDYEENSAVCLYKALWEAIHERATAEAGRDVTPVYNILEHVYDAADDSKFLDDEDEEKIRKEVEELGDTVDPEEAYKNRAKALADKERVSDKSKLKEIIGNLSLNDREEIGDFLKVLKSTHEKFADVWVGMQEERREAGDIYRKQFREGDISEEQLEDRLGEINRRYDGAVYSHRIQTAMERIDSQLSGSAKSISSRLEDNSHREDLRAGLNLLRKYYLNSSVLIAHNEWENGGVHYGLTGGQKEFNVGKVKSSGISDEDWKKHVGIVNTTNSRDIDLGTYYKEIVYDSKISLYNLILSYMNSLSQSGDIERLSPLTDEKKEESEGEGYLRNRDKGTNEDKREFFVEGKPSSFEEHRNVPAGVKEILCSERFLAVLAEGAIAIEDIQGKYSSKALWEKLFKLSNFKPLIKSILDEPGVLPEGLFSERDKEIMSGNLHKHFLNKPLAIDFSEFSRDIRHAILAKLFVSGGMGERIKRGRKGYKKYYNRNAKNSVYSDIISKYDDIILLDEPFSLDDLSLARLLSGTGVGGDVFKENFCDICSSGTIVSSYYSYLSSAALELSRALKRKALSKRYREQIQIFLHLNRIRGIFENSGGVDILKYKYSFNDFIRAKNINSSQFRGLGWGEVNRVILNQLFSDEDKKRFSEKFTLSSETQSKVTQLAKNLQDNDVGILEEFLKSSGLVNNSPNVGSFLISTLFDNNPYIPLVLIQDSGLSRKELAKLVDEVWNARCYKTITLYKDDDEGIILDESKPQELKTGVQKFLEDNEVPKDEVNLIMDELTISIDAGDAAGFISRKIRGGGAFSDSFWSVLFEDSEKDSDDDDDSSDSDAGKKRSWRDLDYSDNKGKGGRRRLITIGF